MTPTLNTEAIPGPLIDLEQWICWREDDRDGKPTKVPIKPYHTSGTPYASATDPQTWRDFETALTYHRERRSRTDGVGFVFDTEAEIVGVDLDNCRDPETGELAGWAADIVERFDSYTEISPSGTGVHVLVLGVLPLGRNRRGDVEMYDRDRFFTVTGEHLEDTPRTVARRQDALLAVHHEYVQTAGAGEAETLDEATASSASGDGFRARASESEDDDDEGNATSVVADTVGPDSGLHRRFGQDYSAVDEPALEAALHGLSPEEIPDPIPRTIEEVAGPGVDLTDEEVLERATNSKSGETIRALLDGDSSLWTSRGSRYPSQSEADMGLCFYLGFWTGGDPERMDRLFRDSGLMREKWDRQHYGNGATYGAVCVARTLLKLEDYYSPPARDQPRSRRDDKVGRRDRDADVQRGTAHNRDDAGDRGAAHIDLGAVEDAQRLAKKVTRQRTQLEAYEDRIAELEAQVQWYRTVLGLRSDGVPPPDGRGLVDDAAAVREVDPVGEPAPPPEGDMHLEDSDAIPLPGLDSDVETQRSDYHPCDDTLSSSEHPAAASSTASDDRDSRFGLGSWLRRWWL